MLYNTIRTILATYRDSEAERLAWCANTRMERKTNIWHFQLSTSSLRIESIDSDEMKKSITLAACRYFGLVLLVSPILLHLLFPNKTSVDFRAPSFMLKTPDERYDDESFHQKTDNTINTINLIGERHCGTKWITGHLEDCFGDHLKVLNRYTRYKHWFQYEDAKLYPSNSTIVVAMVRDPYDWLESMRRIPYHSPHHFDLDWKTFLTRPWGMERGPADQQLMRNGSTINATCMHRFPFDGIIPCSELDRNMYNGTRNGRKVGVTYELNQDGSGRPYESILKLRSDKIRNFLNMSGYDAVHAFFPVQFEFLVTRGTSELIDELEKVTGHRAKCKRADPQTLSERKYKKRFIHWVNEYLDWDTEKLIGYFPKRSDV
ncbi:hypothetical protein ACHAWX_003565 [Stephanocyclus meneghinianus]